MVPKIHKRGSSFKGAAAYLLHDKGRAQTAERVAWTQTRNLAVDDDPQTAWRIMAATAMDQSRLKEEAGIKATGRKSSQAVLHFTLSWHPDEKVSREEMLSAADGAIEVLKASDRQAMVICHTDEEQPHIHILLNRISPEDGRMLSTSKEKLKLSKWAEAYEKERGKVYCEQRVINNAARDRGEFTRAEKEPARHIFEQGQAVNDNEAKAGQRRKDLELARKSRQMQDRHREEWKSLETDFQSRKSALQAQKEIDIGKAKAEVRKSYRRKWEEQHHEHESQKRLFEKQCAQRTEQLEENEQTLLGKAKNRVGAIKELFTRGAISSPEQRLRSAHQSEEREIEQRQARENASLEAQQKAEERLKARKVTEDHQEALQGEIERFRERRNDLILTQQLEQGKIRAEWKTRNAQRREAFAEMEAEQEPKQSHMPEKAEAFDYRKRLKQAFESSNDNQRDRGSDDRGR
ncbi:MAG: relaxase/mobilization nuclease domain-containing protein [Verrucomicrobiae bacterium]|nr:relaxase/mobilization nuclease domain-containing protein [Verrucomicrobiae bacterium]